VAAEVEGVRRSDSEKRAGKCIPRAFNWLPAVQSAFGPPAQAHAAPCWPTTHRPTAVGVNFRGTSLQSERAVCPAGSNWTGCARRSLCALLTAGRPSGGAAIFLPLSRSHPRPRPIRLSGGAAKSTTASATHLGAAVRSSCSHPPAFYPRLPFCSAHLARTHAIAGRNARAATSSEFEFQEHFSPAAHLETSSLGIRLASSLAAIRTPQKRNARECIT